MICNEPDCPGLRCKGQDRIGCGVTLHRVNLEGVGDNDGFYEFKRTAALSDKEDMYKTIRAMAEVLDLINAEWKNDPMSVVCFDLRTVKKADTLVKRYKEITENNQAFKRLRMHT